MSPLPRCAAWAAQRSSAVRLQRPPQLPHGRLPLRRDRSEPLFCRLRTALHCRQRIGLFLSAWAQGGTPSSTHSSLRSHQWPHLSRAQLELTDPHMENHPQTTLLLRRDSGAEGLEKQRSTTVSNWASTCMRARVHTHTHKRRYTNTRDAQVASCCPSCRSCLNGPQRRSQSRFRFFLETILNYLSFGLVF